MTPLAWAAITYSLASLPRSSGFPALCAR